MFVGLSNNITSTFNRIINSQKKLNKIRENQISELVANINHAKKEMQLAMDNFNNVTEPKLIDFYIYRIQSEQTRFEQLMSEYKALYGMTEN